MQDIQLQYNAIAIAAADLCCMSIFSSTYISVTSPPPPPPQSPPNHPRPPPPQAPPPPPSPTPQKKEKGFKSTCLTLFISCPSLWRSAEIRNTQTVIMLPVARWETMTPFAACAIHTCDEYVNHETDAWGTSDKLYGQRVNIGEYLSASCGKIWRSPN